MSNRSESIVSHALNFLPYLLTRGEVSLFEVADDLRLSQREVKRVVRLLQFCGVPPYGGGDIFDCYLDTGAVRLEAARASPLRPPRLDHLELLSLTLGICLEGQLFPVNNRNVESLLQKVALAGACKPSIPLVIEGGPSGAADPESRIAGILPRRWGRLRNHSDADYPLSIDTDILLPEEEARRLDEVNAPFLKAVEYGLPGGMARIRIASDSLEWIVSFVLRYAGEAIVQWPEHVRQAVLKAAEDIVRRYQENSPPED